MSFDPVHSTQAAYRLILKCLSCPGYPVSLAQYADGISFSGNLTPIVMLLALTLLDSETGFAVRACRNGLIDMAFESHASTCLASACSCPQEEVSRAPFIFLLSGGGTVLAEGLTSFIATLKKANPGTLLAPHLGATVIVELSESGVNNTPWRTVLSDSSMWRFSGPGILSCRQVFFQLADSNMLRELFQARAGICSEFPIGIDLLLVSPDGQVIGIPRTTLVEEVSDGVCCG